MTRPFSPRLAGLARLDLADLMARYLAMKATRTAGAKWEHIARHMSRDGLMAALLEADEQQRRGRKRR